MEPWILGLGGSHHNGSACLLHGDRIVAAIQEERLVGLKRYPLEFGANSLAVRYCLAAAGIQPRDLALIVCCPTAWSKEPSSDVLANTFLAPLKHRIPVHYVPHHLAHAAGAFATSGFADAAILVVDGMGSPYCDLTAAERRVVRSGLSGGSEAHSFYSGTGNSLIPLEKHLISEGRWRCYSRATSTVDLENNPVPLAPEDLVLGEHVGMGQFFGLGHMYDRVGNQIFGDPHNGPGKVMGLAPYGVPSFAPSDFFKTDGGTFAFLPTVPDAFQHRIRWPNREQEYRDLAAATQAAFETGMSHLVRHLRKISDSGKLVIAGGCALNSVANERLHQERVFDDIYVFPAAEDSGIAVGAAYIGYQLIGGPPKQRRLRRDSFGRNYSMSEVDSAIARVPMLEVEATANPLNSAVEMLTNGKIVSLFEGGSELGPRALGQRSILCDPRLPEAKKFINERVKFREGFRPFAPAILQTEVSRWFLTQGGEVECPFMLRVLRFCEDVRDRVPAVVHVDGTGRLQTVSAEDGGMLYQCLTNMFERTGVPILLNTSFNLQSEPIVETPEDALWTVLFCGIDACLFNGRLVTKKVGQLSPLSFTVVPNAQIVDTGKSHLTLSTKRPYLGQWDWRIEAGSAGCRLIMAVVQAAAERPTGGELIRDLRRQFGTYHGVFLPPSDGHALALMRRSGLIDLAHFE